MHSAFERLYETYHQDLFQFLFYLVKNREHAEDLSQEVYVRVLKNYSSFEGKSSEKTWLFSIAKHVAIDFFRKQSTRKKRILSIFDSQEVDVKDENPLPEEVLLQNEDIQLMYRCLDRCKVEQKMVLLLRFLQSMSISETAASLGWTESKVKTTQHRAMKTLRMEMEAAKEKEGDTA
ncbi:RNA polymerase sigma factor SigX [Bacillus fonticola]|uniref:RNA polymerase sigma factor SigX n=1 Tax=Bacillus fonticola TaxID=2728853 RepID=UPI00147537C3|nr:RNA polymerase sigma factor SigX [Bacillus fonticola]